MIYYFVVAYHLFLLCFPPILSRDLLSRESGEEELDARELLRRAYSKGPVSPTCYDLKGRKLLCGATLDDSTTPTPVMCIIQVWQYATFIVFASSLSG
jgi:hypothetical protein